METNVVDERRQFVLDFASGQWSMSELCERYGVSRPTGYKWLARQRAEGDDGWLDSIRAPHHCPHRTGDDVEALLLAARREFGWGAKKLLLVLAKRHPAKAWPARSTVSAILERHGVLHKNDDGASGAIQAQPRSRPSGRTRCGPPISKGSSRPATATTAIR